MFRSKALLTLVLITLSAVDATILGRDTRKSSLRITARTNGLGGGSKIAERDRARASALMWASSPSKSDVSSTDISQQSDYSGYTAEVGIGTPPTYYTLLVDTGSSNTWIGANKTYKPTSSSRDTGNTVAVRYGTGNFSGNEWTDTVALSADLVITNQSIGVANLSFGFQGMRTDGILGIGPKNLTANTVNNTTLAPTVADNLYLQGMIAEEVLGVYFVPATESSDGELTFGGYDSSVTTQTVEYVPLTATYPSSKYWGFNQSVTYGNETIFENVAGIADTGTTLIMFPTNVFQKYQNLTGGIMDNSTGLLAITLDQYDKLQPLSFRIGERSYTLTANAQIWPRTLNGVIGGEPNMIYLVAGDLGSIKAPHIGFINGYTFLERFYSVFDTTNNRIGFASTHYTDCNCN